MYIYLPSLTQKKKKVLSGRKPGFDSKAFNVEFVVDEVVLKNVSLLGL
jgi:hypothetical protein